MFDVSFRSAIIVVACVFGSTAVDAADIRVDPSRPATAGVVFEGKIEAGDFDKFKSFILNGANPVEIYLASPGGDLAEAMKIGILVRNLKVIDRCPKQNLD